MTQSPDTPDETSAPERRQEVQYQHTPNLPGILEQLRISLVVSTYQAGKVLVLGSHQGQLKISLLDYERPMGVAITTNKIAIGAGSAIHFLTAHHEVARQVTPVGTHDGCFLPHTSRHTGKILVHDLGWGSEGLWVCNTLFSCLCTLDDSHNFVPRWKPRFISNLADQDRCHLNGMAMDRGVPRFVTALAPTDTPAGWRADKARTGCLIDVASGEFVAQGLCMPHSPRVHQGRLFVLNSGYGHLSVVDTASGRLQPVELVPGYTRGLGFHGQFAFVGLSRIRETNVFGGLPIGAHRDELCCGIAVIDLQSGQTVSTFRFLSGVEEIFAVDVLPAFSNPVLSGASLGEKQNEIWIVPPRPPLERLVASSSPAVPAGSPEPLAGPAPNPGGVSALRGSRVPSPPQSSEGDRSGLSSSHGEEPGPLHATVGSLRRQGLQAHMAGRLDESLRCYEQALRLQPADSETLNLLGNLHQDRQAPGLALDCYRQALADDPRQSYTQRNLGLLYVARNQPREAIEHFELAQAADPQPMNRLLAGQVLPVIYDSTTEVHEWRTRFGQQLRMLNEEGVTIDTTDTLLPTPFYLAYQGENDRELMARLGRIHRGVTCRPAAAEGGWRPAGRRLRVGFASAYFCNHTIGRLNVGLIERLPRERFEVTVIDLRRQADQVSAAFRRAADRAVVVSREPAQARREIAALDLDLLLFADVGMDSLAQTLCYSRMAPWQAVTWGHPDTTGSPAIDLFVSSQLAESADADGHYTEQLVRLPTLGVCYPRPVRERPERGKQELGLDPRRRAYVCPQTLFKFHPEFDAALSAILAADPGGDLVLLQGGNPEWMSALQARWSRTLPEAGRRVIWLKALPRDDYLNLLAAADVVLDPFPFCGGNSSYEAFAVGAPVVTLPGHYLRGRLTLGMYRRMQLESHIPETLAEYVATAVRLATDEGARGERSRAIQEQAGVLYDSPADVAAWAETLERVITQPV